MKRTLTVLSALIVTGILIQPAVAQRKSSSDVRVRSYTKKDGTRVQSAMRTKADKTTRNNFSTKGNTNPYTGKRGTKRP